MNALFGGLETQSLPLPFILLTKIETFNPVSVDRASQEEKEETNEKWVRRGKAENESPVFLTIRAFQSRTLSSYF